MDIFEDTEPYYALEQLRHHEVSPLMVANLLFRFCEPKLHGVSDDNLATLANITIEKLSCDSPLTEVLRSLDCVEFNKKIFKNLQFDYDRFFHFCRLLCSRDKQGFDIIGIAFFSKPWKNNAYFQLEFIKFCIRCNNLGVILSNCNNSTYQLNKHVPQLDLLKCQPDDGDMQLLPWKFQCLFQILVDLSETQILNQMVEEIFFFPLNKCPDLLILGLLECTGNNTRLKEVVLIKAILKFLYPTSAHPNSTQIFQRIWPNDFNHTHVNSLTWSQRLLLTSMIELYSSSTPEEQQQKLSRILDLSQDLKALNLLLSSNSYLFVIDLACLASRREYLKLDKWLNDKIQTNGQPFIEVCVTFLKRRCPAFGPNESSSMTFPNETFTTILNCLRQHISDNPKTLAELELVKMLAKYSQTLPDVENEFSKEVEEEADSYLRKIYNQDLPDSMSIDQVLDMLKKFQESPNKREKEVFACMIRNLFKEYPFLFQYPDKELEITGEIFGGIILYDFVKGYSFVGALRYVLESLKKPINSQYFTFGKAALNKFKSRLKEFPQFCQHLINIPHFREFPPLLAEYIEYGKQSQEPPIAVSSNGAAFGNAFNVKKMSTNSNPTMPVMPFINKSVNSGNDTPMNIVPEIVPPNAFQDKIEPM